MRYFIVLLTLALTACGVDGAPERPERVQATPGLAVSGSVSVGVAGSSN